MLKWKMHASSVRNSNVAKGKQRPRIASNEAHIFAAAAAAAAAFAFGFGIGIGLSDHCLKRSDNNATFVAYSTSRQLPRNQLLKSQQRKLLLLSTETMNFN